MSNKNSTSYTLLYAAILTVVVAVSLALAAEGLRERQEINIAFEKKANILNSVGVDNPDKVEAIYAQQVQEIVVDINGEMVKGVEAFDIDIQKESKKKPEDRLLPLFIYINANSERVYVVPVRGVGLWGPIWGYVALQEDFSTVRGVVFDHKTETPGLGAEIKDDPGFSEQFINKKILNEQDEFVSITIMKGAGNVLDEHSVDGITGSTFTCRGADKMLKTELKNYLPYFKKIKSQ